ncbi:unnamed protein product [Tilletia caries]|nr:unnamed protein product [Tilletia caries]
MVHNDGLRKHLQSASIWYSALGYYAHAKKLQSARILSDEASKDKSMAHSSRHPQLIVAIDGNFTQRRLADLKLVQRSALPPAFFLSAQQVGRARDGQSAGHRAWSR